MQWQISRKSELRKHLKEVQISASMVLERLINTTSDASDIGEFVYQKPDYDIAVMWQMINDMVQVSLRSNTVDCAEIAQKYGGGGHRGAAGFTIKSGGEFSVRLFETDQ